MDENNLLDNGWLYTPFSHPWPSLSENGWKSARPPNICSFHVGIMNDKHRQTTTWRTSTNKTIFRQTHQLRNRLGWFCNNRALCYPSPEGQVAVTMNVADAGDSDFLQSKSETDPSISIHTFGIVAMDGYGNSNNTSRCRAKLRKAHLFIWMDWRKKRIRRGCTMFSPIKYGALLNVPLSRFWEHGNTWKGVVNILNIARYNSWISMMCKIGFRKLHISYLVTYP